MEDRKVLLSVKDLEVKFHVRGRVLTAIRGISLDIFENESIAIVGESGSGKSVFTKTFAGMLDSNGFISHGDIIFNDDELVETVVAYDKKGRETVEKLHAELNQGAGLEAGSATWQKLKKLDTEHKLHASLSEEEQEKFEKELEDLKFAQTESYNYKLTLDSSKEKALIKETEKKISDYKKAIKDLELRRKQRVAERKAEAAADAEYQAKYAKEKVELESAYAEECRATVSEVVSARNLVIAKEILLSTGRIGGMRGARMRKSLLKACIEAMKTGSDLGDEEVRNRVFDTVIFRVRYIDETENKLHGQCVLNLAKIKEQTDWTQIRGRKIATVFQDPMTSLNPIITIGKQIMSVILKHQNCTEIEARERALTLMKKVGIPNAEQRFDDYPFQYSGGMRQRIVIAIALSCQPKILICDEPTTALDVTIQAQILRLLKKLQKEFNYTIVFITHDLGVVANVADRVAVLYAGQIVELGNVDEVFFDPRHPYTWALMSSMPQLAERNTVLYSITGTPPSLYNKIVGDPFAPRNPYCIKLDTLKEPPMFRITDTHFAKTWLLDPRAPKVEKPETIQNIHEKLIKAFNI
ncbi:MAG: ATP-binding cassette domain-containing protein [Clostridia bacterium]|nr:ATP-binding cassette domain-containing protein [Clostridia bacterium]